MHNDCIKQKIKKSPDRARHIKKTCQSFLFFATIIITAIAMASASPAIPATSFVANSDIAIKSVTIVKLYSSARPMSTTFSHMEALALRPIIR